MEPYSDKEESTDISQNHLWGGEPIEKAQWFYRLLDHFPLVDSAFSRLVESATAIVYKGRVKWPSSIRSTRSITPQSSLLVAHVPARDGLLPLHHGVGDHPQQLL